MRAITTSVFNNSGQTDLSLKRRIKYKPMRITQNNSLLSSQNALQRTNHQNAPRTSLNSSPKITVSGINNDKVRGANEANRKNELQKMVADIKTAAEDFGSLLTDMMEHSKAAGRKLFEQLENSTAEIEKIRAEAAENETAAPGQAEMVDENGAAANTITNTDGSGEITEPAVAVEVSPEIKTATADTGHGDHVSASAHRDYVSSENRNLDVRV